MINDIMLKLYIYWLNKFLLRQRYIDHNTRSIFKRSVPEWGLRVSIARHMLYLFFFLYFRDLKWRNCRQLVSDKDSIDTASLMWKAFTNGIRSYEDYKYSQWLKKNNLTRQLALPQGEPVLALPEGRESFLVKEIRQIEAKTHRGCGLYYEIYEPRVLGALRALRNRLNEYDLAIFHRILPEFGWDLSDEIYEASLAAETELYNELHMETE